MQSYLLWPQLLNIERTKCQEREFTGRGAARLTDLADDNTQRKEPLFSTSSPGPFLTPPALNLKDPDVSVLWNHSCPGSEETTSYPCPNNKRWHHLPHAPAAPLSHRCHCFEVVSLTRGLCVHVPLYCTSCKIYSRSSWSQQRDIGNPITKIAPTSFHMVIMLIFIGISLGNLYNYILTNKQFVFK